MLAKGSSAITSSSLTQDQSYAQNLAINAREIVESLTLIPMIQSGPTVDYLLNELDKQGKDHLIILDQKVQGIEQIAVRTNYGYEYQSGNKKITVIDHHVNDPEFSRLSTGNLAIEYFKAFPDGPPKEALITITHGDCDSVISALIMKKQVPAEPAFGVAVMSADHNFEKNKIADLLQALESTPGLNETVRSFIPTAEELIAEDPLRAYRLDLPEKPFIPSLELSVRNLGLLLANNELDPDAQMKVQQRTDARLKWIERIENQQVVALENGTNYCIIPDKITSDPYPEFLQALLPNAKIILVFHNPPEDFNFMQVRAILGNAAPSQIALNDGLLIPQDLIPGFGGRRDAGSNRRNMISLVADPKLVAEQVDSNLWRQLK